MTRSIIEEHVKQLPADDLTKQKIADEIAKLRADLRELERPQHRRLPVVASMITAMVALISLLWQQCNVKVERDIARNEALLAKIDRADTLRSLEDEKDRYENQLNALRDELRRLGQGSSATAPASQRIALLQEAIPDKPLNDELTIARSIEAHVRAGEYRQASDSFDALRRSHFSGVGFSAYPELVLAFDQIGADARAMEVLQALEAKVAQDKANGRGYLTPGRPPIKFLLRDFDAYIPLLNNSELRGRCNEVVANLQKLE